MKTSARRALAVTFAALIAAVWLAPVASAQLPDSGSGGGSVGGATDTVTDTVTDTTTDTTGDTSGTVGEVTDPVTGDDDTGSTVDPIGDVKKTVDKTVNDTSESVDETTGGATGPVTDTITKTISDTGDTLDSTTGTSTGTKKNKSRKKTKAGSGGSVTPRLYRDGVTVTEWLTALNFVPSVGAEQPATRHISMASGYAPVETGEGFLSKLGRIATEAAERMAFPLALTLLVVGFLVVQGRIDRKDPKLALAPVDAEHELLSFS